jgi:hypothetical protein
VIVDEKVIFTELVAGTFAPNTIFNLASLPAVNSNEGTMS